MTEYREPSGLRQYKNTRKHTKVRCVTKQQHKPLAWYNAERWQIDHEAGERQTLTVIEDEPRQAETGLLDHHGNKLCRNDTKDPIGFKWRGE